MKFSAEFLRRAAEIGRLFRNFKYEPHPNGIAMANGVLIGGVFGHAHCPAGGAWGALEHDRNRLVTQGLIDLLNSYFNQGTQHPAFYLMPFEGNATPDAAWTAANFNGNADEFTAYTASNRLTWTPTPATSTPSTGNAAALAQLTLNPAGGPFNIYGAAMTTVATKGNTGGVLVAATRFANPRLGLAVNDKLGLEYVFTAQDLADVAP